LNYTRVLMSKNIEGIFKKEKIFYFSRSTD